MLKLKRRTHATKEGKNSRFYIWGQGPDNIFYREALGTDRRQEAEQAFAKRYAQIHAHAERTGAGDDLPIADLISFYLLTPGEAQQQRDDRFFDKIAVAIGEDRVSQHDSNSIRDIACCRRAAGARVSS